MKYADFFLSVTDKGRFERIWVGELHHPVRAPIHWQNFMMPESWKLKEVGRVVSPFTFDYAIVVRTDVQPFWWIVIAIQLKIEKFMKRAKIVSLQILWKFGLFKLSTDCIYPSYANVAWDDIAFKYFLMGIVLIFFSIFVPGFDKLIVALNGIWLLILVRVRCLDLIEERERTTQLIKLEAICRLHHFFTPSPDVVYRYEHGLMSTEELHEEIRRSQPPV